MKLRSPSSFQAPTALLDRISFVSTSVSTCFTFSTSWRSSSDRPSEYLLIMR